MDRTTWAQGLTQQLYTAEQKLDEALAAVNTLSAAVALGRIDQGISAVIGQETLAGLAGSQTSIVEGRRMLIEAHGAMKADARRAGITGWELAGPFEQSPADTPTQGRHLTRVA